MNQTRRHGVIAALMTAALLLAGCASPTVQATVQAPVAPAPASQSKALDLVNNLNKLTDKDLASAISLATSMKDAQAATCFQFVQQELPALRNDVAALNAHVGLFTTFEAGHVVVGWAQNGLPDQATFETKCGPYVLNVIGGLNFILEQIKVNPVPLPNL